MMPYEDFEQLRSKFYQIGFENGHGALRLIDGFVANKLETAADRDWE
jgi:hypothetical protein